MYPKLTALAPEEQARIVRLYRWLYGQTPRRTLQDVAKELQISAGVLSTSLRRSVIPRERYRALRDAGFPADVLPKPGIYVPGRNGGYFADDAVYD